jgi:hypothetical protein
MDNNNLENRIEFSKTLAFKVDDDMEENDTTLIDWKTEAIITGYTWAYCINKPLGKTKKDSPLKPTK